MDANMPQVHYSAFATGQPQHVHKSYIWLRSVVVCIFVLFAVFAGGANGIANGIRAASEVGLLTPMLGVLAAVALLLVVFLIVLVYHVLAYKRLYFVMDEQELGVYSGVITKRRVHVPYARVQSVNHTATLLQRIVGVCTVKIDTAGGAANKAVEIPYVTLAMAEGIRADLFARKQAALEGAGAVVVRPRERADGAGEIPQAPTADADEAPGASAHAAYENINSSAGSWRGIAAGMRVAEEQASYSASLSGGQLLLTGLSHAGAGVSAVVLGIVSLFGAFGAVAGEDGVGFALAAALCVAGIAGGWVIGAVSAAVSYAGFRVARRGSRVEVEHGALKHVFSGIDIERVQGVTIRQTFVRRLLGYCEVTLERVSAASDSAADGSADKSDVRGVVVHPFIRVGEAQAFVDALVPEFAEAPARAMCERLPACALRRALLRRCVWRNWAFYLLAAVLACNAAFGPLLAQAIAADEDLRALASAHDFGLVAFCVVCALVIALRAIGAVLWHRGSGLAFNRRFATVFNDGLSTKLSVVPRNKIQAGCTRANPFQRAAGVASVRAITAAGVGSTTVELWDVDAARAREWLQWLEPRQARSGR